jgi:hypothetical protein
MGEESVGVASAEVVRISDGDTQQFPLDFGTPHAVRNLAPGHYAVRAFMPSGAVMSRTVEVGKSGDVPVNLTVPRSPHEWLAWETVLGEAPSVAEYALAASGPKVPDLWMRLWAPASQWQPAAWPSSLVTSDLVSWKVQISTPPVTPLALELGGPREPWRTVILPPGNQSEIVMRPPAAGGGSLGLTVGTAKRHYDSLLRYLQSGDQAALGVLESRAAETAEAMLFEKTTDPFGAVVGGYALVMLGAFARMHSWSRNLSDWFPSVADGAIIHATRRLREGTRASDTEVREQLLTAAARPTPILSQGVELLHRGLRLLRKEAAEDAAVEAAYQRVDTLAAAMDWSRAFTTFASLDPNTPQVPAPTGIPEPAQGLQWLPEGDGYVSTSLPLEPGGLEAGGFVRSIWEVAPGPKETGGWLVRGPSLTRTVRKKSEAQMLGREFAAQAARATLVVQRADGSVQNVQHLGPKRTPRGGGQVG